MGQTYNTGFLTKVAKGLNDGISAWSLRAYGGITTTYLPVWNEGTAYSFLSANMSSPTISSSDANDTAAGTGARTVSISGVDASFARQTETLSLNGQTGVALVNSYMTIDSMTVLTAGSGGTNAGNIYVGTGVLTAGKPAVVHNRMSIGATSGIIGNNSASSWYVTAANYYLYITQIRIGAGSATAAALQAKIEILTNLGLKYGIWQESFSNPGGLAVANLDIPIQIPPKTQMIISALASAGGPNATVQMRGFLVDSSNTMSGLTF